MNWLRLIDLAPLIVFLAVAALIDARERRIPNWLTGSLLMSGLAFAFIFGGPGAGLNAILGVLAGASIPLVMFMISALGGGDVKLLAGVGAWLGPRPVVAVLVVEAVLGLIIVLIQAVAQRRMRVLLRNSALITASFVSVSEVGMQHAIETGQACRSVSRPLPYAVPVLIATLMVLSLGLFAGR